MTENIATAIDVRQCLPHRYPFLLVDKVNQLVLGESIEAVKNVTHNEPFFNGHFPEQPVMPGVLMVEALAQASGILICQTLGADRVEIFYLAGIDEARFKRQVEPGDVLTLRVRVEKRRRELWKFYGEAWVGEELACSVRFKNFKA